MTQSQLNYKQVIISDVEKHIDIKIVQKFLEKTQIVPQIVRFRKDNHKIHLEFDSEQNAQHFIEEHNHRTQILARKFNIYYSFFDSNKSKFQRLYVNGISEAKLRDAFELCRKYGPCRFKLTYENNKLLFSCIIEFLKFKAQQDLQELRQAFQGLQLKLRPDQMFGSTDQFRCSIEILNFLPVFGLSLSLEEEESISQKLKFLLRQITEHEVQAIELHKYLHQQQPRIKAYFRFKTAELTLKQFEKIRKYFLNKPEIFTKLFYFQDDANNFYTLFTVNLINPEEQAQKQFQNKLLLAFREINPNITQILVKKQFKNYTGKIYMTDEQSGKDFLANYQKNRHHIYQFYKANSVISVDIFQNNREQKKQEKYQNNANKMIKHLNKQKGKDRPFRNSQQQLPFVPLHSYNHLEKYDNYSERNQHYKRPQRKQFAEKEEIKYQQKQRIQPQKVNKQKFKQKIEFKQDDFPSL